MRHISTENAPPPGGHYSQGVVHNGTLYVSGQLPVDPRTGERTLGSIEEQTQQALENVAADIDLWGRVNEVYTTFFGEHRPARAVVPTNELHYGFQIEIEAVAAVA